MRSLAMWVILAGCGGGGSAASELSGDWWECQLSDCTTYKHGGIQFRDDDTYTGLQLGGLEPDYTPGAAYCLVTSDNDRGTYVYDPIAGMLTLTNVRGVDDSGTVMIDGDLLHFPLTTYQRIAQTNLTACTF